jgi:hypothetical protein
VTGPRRSTARAAPARAAAAIALSLAVPGAARGDAPTAPASPGEPERAAYIAGLLDAITTIDRDALVNTSNYIYATERNKCQSPDVALRVGCLLEASTRNCAHGDAALREQCKRVSDVVVTNRLGEKAFVSDDVRYDIMANNRDFKTAFARELHRRYAILVAEFSMSRHFPGSAADHAGLATGLEAYCRDVEGTRQLAWQTCISAVVWFIAGEARVTAGDEKR